MELCGYKLADWTQHGLNWFHCHDYLDNYVYAVIGMRQSPRRVYVPEINLFRDNDVLICRAFNSVIGNKTYSLDELDLAKKEIDQFIEQTHKLKAFW